MLVGQDAMSYIAAGYSWAIGVLAAAPNYDFWSQRVRYVRPGASRLHQVSDLLSRRQRIR